MESTSVWIGVMFLTRLVWGSGVWRGRPQRSIAIVTTSYEDDMLSVWFTIVDNFDHPGEIVLVSLPAIKLLFLPLHTTFRRKSLDTALTLRVDIVFHLSSGEIQNCLPNLFGIYLHGRYVCSLSFMQSFNTYFYHYVFMSILFPILRDSIIQSYIA